MYTLAIKNTFIHVLESNELRKAKRRHSYPPTPRKWEASVFQLPPLEEPVQLPVDDSVPMALSDSTTCFREASPFSGEFMSRRKKRRVCRPCKGKRIRYNRFVERLCTQVEDDPTSFSLRDVTLPPSIIANPKKYKLLEAQMHWYQQQLLAGQKPDKLPKDAKGLVTDCLWEVCGD